MTFCKNCGAVLEDGINFCNNCGTPVEAPQVQPQTQAPFEPTQQVYQQPVSPNPFNNPYIQPEPPKPSVAGKVMGIIGMVLGIEGLVYSIIMLIFSFVIMAVCGEPYMATDPDIAMLPSMFFVYNLLGLAQGIAALILGSKARNKGNNSAMPRVAKGLGIPTIILSGIALFLTFMAIGMVA